MIKVRKGNILDENCDVIVVPCTSMGVAYDDVRDVLHKWKYPAPLNKVIVGEFISVNLAKDHLVGKEIIYASTTDTMLRSESILAVKNIMGTLKKYLASKYLKDSFVTVNMSSNFGNPQIYSIRDVCDIIRETFGNEQQILINFFITNNSNYDINKIRELLESNNKDEFIKNNDQNVHITIGKKLISDSLSTKTTMKPKLPIVEVKKKDKKYQVFVSSTYLDLIEERKEASQALLECGCIPAGMELFPAASNRQWEIIKSVIDDCDAYILILAGRYGSMGVDDKGNKVGYTEMEFDYAINSNKPIMAFLHRDFRSIEAKNVEDTEEGRKRLSAFYEKAKDGRVIKYWANKDNLKGVIIQAIEYLKNEIPMVGWIRDTTSAETSDNITTSKGKFDQNGVNEIDRSNEIINEYKHRLYVAEGAIEKQKGDLNALQKQLADANNNWKLQISKKDDRIKVLEKALEDSHSELSRQGYESDSVKKSLGLMLQELKEWAANNGVIF